MVRAVSTRGLVQWKTDEFGLEQVNTVIKKPYVTKSQTSHSFAKSQFTKDRPIQIEFAAIPLV